MNAMSGKWFIGFLLLISSSQLLADSISVRFEPGIVLPEIAAESARQNFKNEKQSVINGKRIANRLSISGDDMRMGLLRYRDENGKILYGFGYRNRFAGQELNTILNEEGIVFAVEQNKVLYNLQIKNEEPVSERHSTYVQFSLMGHF